MLRVGDYIRVYLSTEGRILWRKETTTYCKLITKQIVGFYIDPSHSPIIECSKERSAGFGCWTITNPNHYSEYKILPEFRKPNLYFLFLERWQSLCQSCYHD